MVFVRILYGVSIRISHINKILKQKYRIQLQVKYFCIFHPF
jgi:hypothetical protein